MSQIKLLKVLATTDITDKEADLLWKFIEAVRDIPENERNKLLGTDKSYMLLAFNKKELKGTKSHDLRASSISYYKEKSEGWNKLATKAKDLAPVAKLNSVALAKAMKSYAKKLAGVSVDIEKAAGDLIKQANAFMAKVDWKSMGLPKPEAVKNVSEGASITPLSDKKRKLWVLVQHPLTAKVTGQYQYPDYKKPIELQVRLQGIAKGIPTVSLAYPMQSLPSVDVFTTELSKLKAKQEKKM